MIIVQGKFEDVGASSDEEEEDQQVGTTLAVFQLHGEMSQKVATTPQVYHSGHSCVVLCVSVSQFHGTYSLLLALRENCIPIHNS